MFEQTLHTKTKSVLSNIADFTVKNNFYLAGGTALALHLGHRISVDLDFFSQEKIDIFKLKQDLIELGFKYKVQNEGEGTLDLIINDVKVSFLEYRYSVLNSFEVYSGVNIASVMDIACMKITAISSRGSKKDFFDIWIILKQFSLREIFDAIERKFVGVDYSPMHFLKTLTYFNDAESDPDPILFVEITWEEVKDDIMKRVKSEELFISLYT